MLFILEEYQHNRIAKALYNEVIENCRNAETKRVTVNSSPYAHDVYKKIEMNDLEQIIIEYNKCDLKKFIENKENYMFAGIKDDKSIAFLYGYGMLRPDGRKMFYIHSVDVLPEYQSKGIGTKLMEYTLEYIKAEKKYNQLWCDKDIDKLKEFYDTENNRLIYYDNHKNNDTYTLEEHIALVSEFLTKGKKTESGQVEELIIENFNMFSAEKSVCLCFIAKYKSFPKPHIRTTMYIEKIKEQWKVLHVHCSFEPEK